MVDYVEWHETRREISDEDQSEFYDTPLPELTLFRYSVEQFALPAHRTHFSLKITLKGREDYLFGARRVALDPGSVLFANSGETHASEVTEGVESLSIYVPDADAMEMAVAALSSAEEVLDNPGTGPASLDLAQTPIQMSKASAKACDALLQNLTHTDEDYIECAAATFIQSAIADVCSAAPLSSLRDIRKRSVRDELIARVLRAKAMIDDSCGAFYDLDVLAHEACLSRYHLLRRFADVVGETPGAYARRRRLEAARVALLRGEQASIVAKRAGYRSMRRFRDAYARAFGAH